MLEGIIVNTVNMSFKIALIPDLMFPIAPLLPSYGVIGVQFDRLRTLEAVECEHILRTFEETAWVISGPKGAAAIQGMNPNTLRSRMLSISIARSNA